MIMEGEDCSIWREVCSSVTPATSTTWTGVESKQGLFSDHKTTKQLSRDQACTLQ